MEPSKSKNGRDFCNIYISLRLFFFFFFANKICTTRKICLSRHWLILQSVARRDFNYFRERLALSALFSETVHGQRGGAARPARQARPPHLSLSRTPPSAVGRAGRGAVRRRCRGRRPSPAGRRPASLRGPRGAGLQPTGLAAWPECGPAIGRWGPGAPRPPRPAPAVLPVPCRASTPT